MTAAEMLEAKLFIRDPAWRLDRELAALLMVIADAEQAARLAGWNAAIDKLKHVFGGQAAPYTIHITQLLALIEEARALAPPSPKSETPVRR